MHSFQGCAAVLQCNTSAPETCGRPGRRRRHLPSLHASQRRHLPSFHLSQRWHLPRHRPGAEQVAKPWATMPAAGAPSGWPGLHSGAMPRDPAETADCASADAHQTPMHGRHVINSILRRPPVPALLFRPLATARMRWARWASRGAAYPIPPRRRSGRVDTLSCGQLHAGKWRASTEAAAAAQPQRVQGGF